MESPLTLPSWAHLDLASFTGLTLIVGEPDAGKSTFARYLYGRLCQAGLRVAYIDGDPGQSTLGPPTTLSLAFGFSPGQGAISPAGQFPPPPPYLRSFTGSVSPRGHMLELVTGASRLVRAACLRGAQSILYDTCGLVDPGQGGLSLKMAKIDMLRPQTVIAIQKESELEALLIPLKRSRRTRLVVLPASTAVQHRSAPARQSHRARQFREYFADAAPLWVDWTRLAVFPMPVFVLNRLVALEDVDGFTLALGIVKDINSVSRRIQLLTPLRSLQGVDSLQLGDVVLDPDTFQDTRINQG